MLCNPSPVVLAQSGKDITELARRNTIKLGHPKEEDLALHLCKFPEAVEVRSQPPCSCYRDRPR